MQPERMPQNVQELPRKGPRLGAAPVSLAGGGSPGSSVPWAAGFVWGPPPPWREDPFAVMCWATRVMICSLIGNVSAFAIV